MAELVHSIYKNLQQLGSADVKTAAPTERQRLVRGPVEGRDVLPIQIGGLIAIVVPVVAALWAYNEGYLTPQ